MGQINDTVSRLPGLNTSEMNREAGMIYGPDGAACNPFIGDSYLFLNSATNETHNFGLGSQDTPAAHGSNISNHMYAQIGNNPVAMRKPAAINPVESGAGSSRVKSIVGADRNPNVISS